MIARPPNGLIRARRVPEILQRNSPPAPGVLRGKPAPREIALPQHTYIPERSLPFYRSNRTLVGNAFVVIASRTVAVGRTAFVSFIEEELNGFSLGTDEFMVEWQLVAGGTRVWPYGRHLGVASPRGNPTRLLISQPIPGPRTIELRVRLMPSADGGLDGGSVFAFGSIAGYFVESVIGGT